MGASCAARSATAATLVLIGDPKQAIYAFRGADVYAYLEAARDGRRRSATLDVNWRSDQGLIDAYDALFGGAQLGHEGIVYRHGARRRRAPAPRLTARPSGAAARPRRRTATTPRSSTTASGFAQRRPAAREHVAARPRRRPRRAARLGRGSTLRRAATGASGPGDIAVLVRTNRHAALVRDALDAVGVPAVINGAGSVFATAPARDWLRLLEAIERPTVDRRARAPRR